jgi:hypothetical protein
LPFLELNIKKEHMEFVETEAKKFKTKLFHGSQNLVVSKNTLFAKLDGFILDRYKIIFLNILRKELFDSKIEHEKGCQTQNCGTASLYNNAIFTVDQTIENLNEYYVPTVIAEDIFSPHEQSEILSKINDVIFKLRKLEAGQEIIFDEIDDLKSSFYLGKKKWNQLLTGKIIELGISYGVEKTILDSIYSELIESAKHLAPNIITDLFNIK